jgi:MFS family permease
MGKDGSNREKISKNRGFFPHKPVIETTGMEANPEGLGTKRPRQRTPRADFARLRWMALGLLFCVYVFNFLDRQIFAILQEAIKTDLHLSDTEIGFLGGFAFAIFYTTLGIPIARLADRHSRSKIIAISLALWSLMTALCGAVRGFVTLALARIGVGVGEAGCSPPAHSLIADYFGPSERSTALAIYSLGIPVGAGLSNLIGGYVNVALGWREAFYMVGVPGVLFAIFIAILLKEPVRGLSETRTVGEASLPSLGEVARVLWQRRTFRQLCAAFALTSFVLYGALQWVPTYFIRTYNLDTGTVGTVIAIASGLFSGLSTLVGGLIGDRLAKYDVRWLCWISAIGLVVTMPLMILMLFQPSFSHAAYFLFAASLFNGFHLGPTFGLVQTLVPMRMRALAASILLFATNLVGMGMGPLFIGFASDSLGAAGVVNPLRWAILIILCFTVWTIVHYLLAACTLREDLAAQE